MGDSTAATSFDPDGPDANLIANLVGVENTYVPLVTIGTEPNPYKKGGGGEFINGKKFMPALATSWSTHGNTWIFNLRKGVKAANGDPFTAADIVFTYQRSMALKATGAFLWSVFVKATSVTALRPLQAAERDERPGADADGHDGAGGPGLADRCHGGQGAGVDRRPAGLPVAHHALRGLRPLHPVELHSLPERGARPEPALLRHGAEGVGEGPRDPRLGDAVLVAAAGGDRRRAQPPATAGDAGGIVQEAARVQLRGQLQRGRLPQPRRAPAGEPARPRGALVCDPIRADHQERVRESRLPVQEPGAAGRPGLHLEVLRVQVQRRQGEGADGPGR